jgi:hypothetical protein
MDMFGHALAARPLQAALASAASFSSGSALPLAVAAMPYWAQKSAKGDQSMFSSGTE